MLAAKPDAKKAKSDAIEKEVATAEVSGGPWCKIHNTTKHNLEDCRKVQFLADEQCKEWKENNNKKKD